MKRGSFELNGGVTDVVRELTGAPAESFEVAVRRHACQAFAKPTLATSPPLRQVGQVSVTIPPARAAGMARPSNSSMRSAPRRSFFELLLRGSVAKDPSSHKNQGSGTRVELNTGVHRARQNLALLRDPRRNCQNLYFRTTPVRSPFCFTIRRALGQ